MKKKLLLLTLPLLLASCADKTNTTDPIDPPDPVVSVNSVSITNKADLQAEWKVGSEDRTIEVSLLPLDANVTTENALSTGDLKIISSDTQVVSVSTLTLTALSEGTVTITASYKETYFDTVSLTILKEDFKFSEEKTVEAYLGDLKSIVEQESFTICYNDGSDDYVDKFTSKYVTIRDDYNGYVLLPSINTNDPTLGESMLYSFINENNKATLSLPVTSYSSYYGTTVARSFDDVNYLKKALNESSPIDEGALTLNEDGTVKIKDVSYSYYSSINDLVSITHSGFSYWSLNYILVSKTIDTLTLDYYNYSEEVAMSVTFKDINKTSSEVVEASLDSFKIQEEHMGFYSLNSLRDNRFTVKTTVSKISEVETKVLGVVGSNVGKDQYEFLNYDDTGENIVSTTSHYTKVNGKVTETVLNGFNEVETVSGDYTWDNNFYDFSILLDSEAFRKSSNEEHDYEYFGIESTSIMNGFTYLSLSSYGNLRHLYADTDENGYISSFTACYEEVSNDEGVNEHIEIKIDVLEDKDFYEVSSYTSGDNDLINAFSNSFNETTPYKATVLSDDGSGALQSYVIYYVPSLKSLIREKYTTSDGVTSLDSVDGYKLIEGTSNDGITYFEYDLDTKTAKASKGPTKGDLNDLHLILTSPYLFDKNEDGTYSIKEGIYNVGKTLKYPNGSYYSDDTLKITLSDGKVSKVNFEGYYWYYEDNEEISFDYSNVSISSDYTNALTNLTEFITPTNWVDYNATIGQKLISFLESEEKARQVPFLYTDLIESWSSYSSGDYDDNWDIIPGTEYLNIYPYTYDSSDSSKIYEWLENYEELIKSSGYTLVSTSSSKNIYSNGTIKIGINTTYISSGIYIYKTA